MGSKRGCILMADDKTRAGQVLSTHGGNFPQHRGGIALGTIFAGERWGTRTPDTLIKRHGISSIAFSYSSYFDIVPGSNHRWGTRMRPTFR
jgi:hypothetical protein